jgi:hypothetical protein
MLIVLGFLRHNRQGHSFWHVGERINQRSLFFLVVVEGAALTKLALPGFLPILAGLRLKVRMNCSKGRLAEVLGQRIVALSEFRRSMGVLAVLSELALAILLEVPAHLSLVLLPESVELALVSIKVVVVALLSQLAHDLSWGIVKVFLWLAIGTQLPSVLGALPLVPVVRRVSGQGKSLRIGRFGSCLSNLFRLVLFWRCKLDLLGSRHLG